MRKFVSFISFVTVLSMLAFLPSKDAKASHAAGAELIYVHIADSTYQFFAKFYRDCTGISEPGTFTLCAYNTCTNTQFTATMNKWQGTLPPDNRPNGSSVSAGCSQYSNKCDNLSSSVPGYREWWYMCIVTLPLKCNSYKFAIWENARNNQNNIQPGNLYVETIFNSSQTWENSSPYYSVKPIPYVCLNQPYTYNNGAIDADGDSLWSQLTQPLAGASCMGTPAPATIITLTPPINFNTNPLQTNNTFVLTGGNGQMSFTATQQGASTLTLKTREFRRINNVVHELGSIMRDIQVQVLPCSSIPPTLDTVSINDSGAFLNNKVYGCVGQTLEFCFTVTSTDTGAILIAEDNLITAIPGATMTYTNSKTDSIRGCFKWTPTTNDVGPHSFLVIIKDSTCKPPGILLQYARTVDLEIWGPVQASPDTSICIGEPAFLGVTGGASYQWTVLQGTNPSLSNPNSANPVATPTVTTTYLVTSTINPYCPSFNKDTVVIEVLKGPDMAGQPDILTCPNYEVALNLGIVKNPGVTYSVKWTPAAGLSSDTVDNPKVKIKSTQTYTVSVGSNDNRCKSLDTVLVDVLTGMSIENPDTGICLGQKVDVRGVGDSRYSYSWTHPTDNSPTFSNPGGIQTSITPSDTGVHKYILHAQHANCPGIDSTVNFDIDVQPNPSVQVDEDESMCYGDTMQLTAIVTPNTFNRYTYSWTPGAALDFPDRKNPIFSAVEEGVATLTFVARTPAGCADSDQVSLNVYAAEFITLPADTVICPGDTISLAMQVNPGVKFYWLPDYNISSVSAVQPRVWPVADQMFNVYASDSFGCLDTGRIKVTVRPRAIIDMPDTVTIYPGESYQMDPAGNCLYYTWFPPLGLSNADVSNPKVSPVVNTRYIVHGRTEAGCSVTDSIDILVKNDSYLDLPNAFTPGNRTNGRLQIVRRGVADLKRFAVYNRWGTKVFETSDINQGWDGTFNGEIQPMGVYIYTIEAVTPSGKTFTKQGNVTMIR
jgi:gliding motility-associated-like protein